MCKKTDQTQKSDHPDHPDPEYHNLKDMLENTLRDIKSDMLNKDYETAMRVIERYEEIKDDMEDWIIEEVAPKVGVIDEIVSTCRLQEYKKEIFSMSCTPFYHYMDAKGKEQPKPMRPKQRNYLMSLAEDNTQRFFAYVNLHEDLDSVGKIEEIIDKLNRKQASRIIDYMLGKTTIEDVKTGL